MKDEKKLTKKEIYFEEKAVTDHEDLEECLIALKDIDEEVKNTIVDHSAGQAHDFITESRNTRQARAWERIPDVIEVGKRPEPEPRRSRKTQKQTSMKTRTGDTTN